MEWRLRLRFGYLKKYGRSKKFPFGFTIGPILFYKPRNVFRVKKYIDKDALIKVNGDLSKMVYEDAKQELFDSTPYDFEIPKITSYTDYDIDYNRYGLLLEGVSKPKKG